MMKCFLVTFAIWLAAAAADISHLFDDYLPTNYNNANHHYHHPNDIQMALNRKQRPDTQSFETKIEKHEVLELPTQIEIIAEGRPIYGVHPLSSGKNSYDNIPKIAFNSLSPSIGNENLQPPQIPYEESMKILLPPVATGPNSQDVPQVTTTNIPSMKETNNEGLSKPKLDINNYAMAIKGVPAEENTSLAETISMLMPFTPQNQYLPPVGLTSAPSESMPQITYQQYQEQFIRAEKMKHTEMQSLQAANDVIDHQPVAPLDYDDSFLSKDGWLSL